MVVGILGGLTDLWSGFQVYPEPLNARFMSRDCNALSPESLQPSFQTPALLAAHAKRVALSATTDLKYSKH